MTQIKVALETDGRVETLWADALDDGTYRLQNIPLFSALYALHDVVHCEIEGGRPVVQRVVLPSGNGTIPAVLFGELTEDEVKGLCRQLDTMGLESTGLSVGTAHFRSFLIRSTENLQKFDTFLDEWFGEDE